jgi:hypothetical protein
MTTGEVSDERQKAAAFWRENERGILTRSPLSFNARKPNLEKRTFSSNFQA